MRYYNFRVTPTITDINANDFISSDITDFFLTIYYYDNQQLKSVGLLNENGYRLESSTRYKTIKIQNQQETPILFYAVTKDARDSIVNNLDRDVIAVPDNLNDTGWFYIVPGVSSHKGTVYNVKSATFRVNKDLTNDQTTYFNTFTGIAYKFSLPSELTTIGENSFINEIFIDLEIPRGVTSIKSKAFSNCEALTTLTIPKLVSEISSQAFSNCKMLRFINFLPLTCNIMPNAFENCDRLYSVNEGVEIRGDVNLSCTPSQAKTMFTYLDNQNNLQQHECISHCRGTFIKKIVVDYMRTINTTVKAVKESKQSDAVTPQLIPDSGGNIWDLS